MTQEQINIKAMADQYLNWTGDDHVNQPGGVEQLYAMYAGSGDAAIDMFMNFNGEGTEAKFNQIKSNRPWTLTLYNGNAATKTVMLMPGIAPDSVNLAGDGVTVAKDGTAVTTTGNPGKLVTLQREINLKPHNVVGCKVVSDSALIETGNFRFIERSAFFQNDKIQVIEFSHYIGDQQRDKLIFIDKPFILADVIQWEVTLPPTSTTVFSFFFGASIDSVHALRKGNARLNAAAGAGGGRGGASGATQLLPATT